MISNVDTYIYLFLGGKGGGVEKEIMPSLQLHFSIQVSKYLIKCVVYLKTLAKLSASTLLSNMRMKRRKCAKRIFRSFSFDTLPVEVLKGNIMQLS